MELKDQQEGIRHLASLGFADTSRMGIYGWSYGGYMTLNTLLQRAGSVPRGDLQARPSPIGATTTASTRSAIWACRRKMSKAIAPVRR